MTPTTPNQAGNQPAQALAAIRFGETKFLEQLVDLGSIRMWPLGHFANQENDGVRGDPFEGIDGNYQPNDVTRWTVSAPGRTFDLTPSGPIRYSLGHTPRLNVLCVALIYPPVEGDLVVPDGRGFGDGFVLFLDPDRFVDRLSTALQSHGQILEHGPVEYVDPCSHSGEWGPFRKPLGYSQQAEYRFVARPGTGQALDLELGPLHEIVSPVGPSSQVRELLRFLE